MINKLKNLIEDMREAKAYDTTYWLPLENIRGNNWAIVFGWGDPYEDGEQYILGKVAYQSPKCVMREYEMDWTMPYDAETGEVDNTEVILTGNGLSDIEWLISQWKRIKEELT